MSTAQITAADLAKAFEQGRISTRRAKMLGWKPEPHSPAGPPLTAAKTVIIAGRCHRLPSED